MFGKESSKHEFWLVLSLVGISAIVALNPEFRVNLFLYLLPTMFAAYYQGRRSAITTAFAAVLFVIAMSVGKALITPDGEFVSALGRENWPETVMWAVLLIGSGWFAGALFSETRAAKDTYATVLCYMMSRGKSRYDRVRRLSHFAGIIAGEMRMNEQSVENVRAAALLYDVAELKLDRERFLQLAGECEKRDSGFAANSTKLSEVLPLAMAHKQGSRNWEMLPTEARILAVADEYNTLTSPRDRRSGLPAIVARNMIERDAGKKFDPAVVRAFTRAFERGMLLSDVGQVNTTGIVAQAATPVA